MHVCYVYSSTIPKNDLCSKNTTKQVKPEIQELVSIKRSDAECSRRHDVHLHIVAFCIAPVEMLSIRTALAARFLILVFSQLISSTAGNYID